MASLWFWNWLFLRRLMDKAKLEFHIMKMLGGTISGRSSMTAAGWDLYCGVRFKKGERLSVEHVYAADWIAEKFGCADRQCDHPTYKFADADLHNLWPALGAINSSRGKSFFGECRNQTHTALSIARQKGSPVFTNRH